MLIRRVQTIFTGVAGTPYYSNHYFAASVGTVDDVTGAISTFWTALEPEMALGLDYTVDPAVQLIDTELDAIISVAVSSITGSGGGTANADILPLTAQGLIRWRTGTYVGGRELRGRTFIPGPTVADAEDGEPISAYLSVLKSAADALVADVDTELVIWSRKNLDASPVQLTSVWGKFASMRSRRD
jgi:hypothetical protein